MLMCAGTILCNTFQHLSHDLSFPVNLKEICQKSKTYKFYWFYQSTHVITPSLSLSLNHSLTQTQTHTLM